jgi:hypothetical protein
MGRLITARVPGTGKASKDEVVGLPMPVAEGLPAPLARGLAALSDGSGRTIVITGPPGSGKSALLAEYRKRLEALGARISDLRGAYRDRETPYALVRPLEDPGDVPTTAEPEEEGGPVVPMAAIGTLVEEGGRSSRRARGERQRGQIMGVTYAVRTRGVADLDPADYWGSLCEEWRKTPGRPRALLVDDATFADDGSRDYLNYLVARARLRPMLLVLVLDSGSPTHAAWEETLLARGDVDWVRRTVEADDPREVSRFKRAFEGLPEPTQRALSLLSVLGGRATEVLLSRVCRLTFRQLADALLPAIEAKLVKVDAGIVAVPHAGWVALLPEIIPAPRLRELHREVAEALEAMHPEPTLAHRRELADHFFRWQAGPTALRYLLEAAELSDQLATYDPAVELLTQAMECVPALPLAERPAAEVELRLMRARGLFFSGRTTEGEEDLRAAVTLAIDRGVTTEQLEDWLEPLLPALLVLGTRPSLVTDLGELAHRCETAGHLVEAVTLVALAAIADAERGRHESAQREARRAGLLARSLEKGTSQALAMLAVARSRFNGSAEELALCDRFLDAAHALLAERRRIGLQQYAEELRARRFAARNDLESALAANLRAVVALERLRWPALELLHQLDIAEILLEAPPDERVPKALTRARSIADRLHLMPPCPSWARTCLLEGRLEERVGGPGPARDRYRAVVEAAEGAVPQALREEARLRLARLEYANDRPDVGRRLFTEVPAGEYPGGPKPTLDQWRTAGMPIGGSLVPLSAVPTAAATSPRKGAGSARSRRRS